MSVDFQEAELGILLSLENDLLFLLGLYRCCWIITGLCYVLLPEVEGACPALLHDRFRLHVVWIVLSELSFHSFGLFMVPFEEVNEWLEFGDGP